MRKLRLAILKVEVDKDYTIWETVCHEMRDHVDWESVDIGRSDWLEHIKKGRFDGLLAIPPGVTNACKNMYDERVRILNTILGLPVYPFLEEIEVYENKKYLAYWLAANGIPHPKTWVFYEREEALQFVSTCKMPLVGKTNVGASGRGVSILKSNADAITYVENTFSGKGAVRSTGPNLQKKGLFVRALKKLANPKEFAERLKHYKTEGSEVQKEYVIFQEFIPHDYEWRCVRIGDSFFAHKKMVKGEKASGSLIKGYENPPFKLLDFVREVTDKRNFRSQSVDIFESADGRYLVNEMQCTFGQSDPYQMLVDGVPGRYRQIDGEWVFEAGDFNKYKSFLLRLEYFVEVLTSNQLELLQK
jgi:glutathione synthase/RimK-type ligase-like ATP-grasp enzyme